MAADTYHLARGAVHCWRVQLDVVPETAARFFATLTSNECSRSARFRFERDRRRFIVARGAARDIVGRYLGIEPGDLRFTYNPFGKPELTPDFGGWLRFNLSHSADLALIGVARDADIGVDVEHLRVDPDHEDVARHFLSADEVEYLNGLPRHRWYHGFFRCWTRKEAVAKAMGEGLTTPDPHGAWSLFDFEPGDGFVGAVAVAGSGWRLHHRNYWPAANLHRLRNASNTTAGAAANAASSVRVGYPQA